LPEGSEGQVSVYDLGTGARLRIPGADRLDLYPVRIVDDDVYVGPRPPSPDPPRGTPYYG
ncbi:MAG: hypothetical protein AAB289_06250, partial [Chloroflexota bacterium]